MWIEERKYYAKAKMFTDEKEKRRDLLWNVCGASKLKSKQQNVVEVG